MDCTLDGDRRGERLPRFVLANTINTSAESAYAVFGHPGQYQRLIPHHYPSVRVLSVRGQVSVAEEHINVGSREIVIMARHVARPPTSHETFFIGGDCKGSHIRHEFVQTADCICTVTSSIDLKMGRLATLFESATRIRQNVGRGGNNKDCHTNNPHKRPSVQESFARMMTDLTRVAESRCN